MTTWHLHLLNARHGLTRIMPEIRASLRQAVAQVAAHVDRSGFDLPDFDLVVRAQPGGTQPEWGIGAQTPAPGLIEVAVQAERFSSSALIRMLVREMHQLIRWDGPGHGRSLGDALVAQGLAGHFVLQVLGGQPDPWDAVRPAPGLARQAMNEWARLDYDHARWFHGKGDLRKWAGYGLGHRLVADYLAQHPDSDPVALAYAPTESFRASLRQLIAADKTQDPQPSGDIAASGTGAEVSLPASDRQAIDAGKASDAVAAGAGTETRD